MTNTGIKRMGKQKNLTASRKKIYEDGLGCCQTKIIKYWMRDTKEIKIWGTQTIHKEEGMFILSYTWNQLLLT